MASVGGSWDNSDVDTAKKRSWSPFDKKYNANEAPTKAGWLGTVERNKGPQKKKAGGKVEKAKPTKKLFGLF